MSKLWSTLKSVVGGGAVEEVATVAAKTASSASGVAPAVTSDGMLQGFAAIKPHQPLIKFRWVGIHFYPCTCTLVSCLGRDWKSHPSHHIAQLPRLLPHPLRQCPPFNPLQGPSSSGGSYPKGSGGRPLMTSRLRPSTWGAQRSHSASVTTISMFPR